MQLKALTESGTWMTDEQCEADKMPGLMGRRELMTMQFAKLVSTGRTWLHGWTREVPARVNSYYGGRLCAGGRVNQATANAWCWMKEAATKGWRRDLQMRVSSLFLVPVEESLPDFCYHSVYPAGQGGVQMVSRNKTTISTRGAFSTGRVLVGRGR